MPVPRKYQMLGADPKASQWVTDASCKPLQQKPLCPWMSQAGTAASESVYRIDSHETTSPAAQAPKKPSWSRKVQC